MKKIILIWLVLITGSAYAEWIVVDRASDDGKPILYDPSTVLRKGNMVDVWYINNFSDDQIKKDSSIKSYASRDRIDCIEGSTRSLKTIYYSEPNGKGKIVISDDADYKATYFPPNSLIATLAKKVCKK